MDLAMDQHDATNEVKVTVENEQDFDHFKLKRKRKNRNNKQKNAARKRKQKEQEQQELMLKLQVKSNNVTLITRDLADKVGNSPVTESFGQQPVNNAEFPALGTRCKVSSPKRDSFPNTAMETGDEKKKFAKRELADFLCVPTTSKHLKPTVQTVENYGGNPLDSDMPIRKKGKYREIPKKKKLSKLKREILKNKSKYEQDIKFQKPETLTLKDVNLCDNNITQELNDLVTIFMSAIVGRQEKLYKRDPIKGNSKRRYVVGLREVKKSLYRNKVKMIILAPDITLIQHDGAMNGVIKELIDLAQTNNTPYLFALKRRSLGTLTLKHIPVTCIAILNYEGLEDHYNNIIQLLSSLKKEKDDSAKDEANQKFLNNLKEALKSDN